MFTMPLHVDAQFGNNGTVRVLHAMDGDPNIARESAMISLAIASYFDNIEVTKTLPKGDAAVTTQCLRNCNQAKHSIMLFRAKLRKLGCVKKC